MAFNKKRQDAPIAGELATHQTQTGRWIKIGNGRQACQQLIFDAGHYRRQSRTQGHVRRRRMAQGGRCDHFPARWQPFQQRREQLLRIDRLGHMVIHARQFRYQAILIEGIGGHGKNGNLLPARQGPNCPGSLQAVQIGHLDIHQHQIVAMLAGALDRFLTIFRHINRQPHAMQQLQRHFAIDRIVFGQQQTVLGSTGAQYLLRMIGRLFGHRQNAPSPLQADGKPEGTALPGHAFNPDFAPHQFSQTAGNDQAQTGAPVLPGR